MENGIGYSICPARQRFTVFEIDEDARELEQRGLSDSLVDEQISQQHHPELRTSIRNHDILCNFTVNLCPSRQLLQETRPERVLTRLRTRLSV